MALVTMVGGVLFVGPLKKEVFVPVPIHTPKSSANRFFTCFMREASRWPTKMVFLFTEVGTARATLWSLMLWVSRMSTASMVGIPVLSPDKKIGNRGSSLKRIAESPLSISVSVSLSLGTLRPCVPEYEKVHTNHG